jgi:hypothetical protein
MEFLFGYSIIQYATASPATYQPGLPMRQTSQERRTDFGTDAPILHNNESSQLHATPPIHETVNDGPQRCPILGYRYNYRCFE